MKIRFDSALAYQIQAVNSLVDLFEGQPLSGGDFSVELTGKDSQGSLFQSELGIGNYLALNNEKIFKNLERVQERNELDPTPKAEFLKNGLNFSVEMETGTGKTYVYLRSIFELHRRYGFKKFIIVVPSVAIREGALKNIEITTEHFRALYNNPEFEYFVYDSKKPNRLRQFASSNQLQIMIINIDSFNKETNIFNQERNQFNGYSPREIIQATAPFVIIDEPQSVDNTPKAQEAIQSLNPLCIFRFSATHKNPYNLIYKLDPIRAYQLRLVKQIVVASVSGINAQNQAYIKLLEVDNSKGIRAKVRIYIKEKGGVKEKDFWVKKNTDLYALSNQREVYQNGFEVLDINCEPGNEFIDFTNGRLYLGQEKGGVTEELIKEQIRLTIKKHLDKELQVKDKGIKVLSLFFVDKVAHYRVYDEKGKAAKGKYAVWFEEFYKDLIGLPQYKELAVYPVEKLHDGYFSTDKKGAFKDTSGSSQADEDTYAKIMRNKEHLLSIEEPLRFIFSHSALREGWDNPNVFQICILREIGGVKERRQTLGRGLRLPVNTRGERVKDETINKLTVIARESYADFAAGLQKEYEEVCGVVFGKVPPLAFSKLLLFSEGALETIGPAESKALWQELVEKGILDKQGKIQPSFNPRQEGFRLGLSPAWAAQEAEIISILESYRLEKHIKKDDASRKLKLNNPIFFSQEFENLWNRIKFDVVYEVNYDSQELIAKASEAIRKMGKIEPARIAYREDILDVSAKGITARQIRGEQVELAYTGGLPDIIDYLQKETELTRATLVHILVKSARLAEFAVNPQRFMDSVASIIKRELYKLMVDGIKYEKISDKINEGKAEWSMRLFREEELKECFEQCVSVQKSVFDQVIYESEVERRFAQELDNREDIELFVKLPSFFRVSTPIGSYNPDWAIVKRGEKTVYLVRETKSALDFEKLRNAIKSNAIKSNAGASILRPLG
jgi:type III restriction enzyme